MAVTIIQSPAEISFSRNRNIWGFKTDNLYSNTGTASAVVFSFPGGPLLDGNAFDVTYNGITQTFTAKDAPDNSGLQVRSGAGLSLLDWCTQLAEDLEGNFKLSRDFDISVELTGVNERVMLVAKVADPIYDISINVQAFVSSTILANGQKKARHASFGIWYQVIVANADGTGFDVVQTDSYLDVNDEGECFPDLRQTLTQSLIGKNRDFEQPDPAMPAVQRNTKSCRKYYIRYAEAYGSTQVIKKVKSTPVKWVMLGGTGKAAEDGFSIPDTFLNGGYHLFLKQEPASKNLALTQCEWLSMVWLTGPIASIKLKVKTYFTVGDPVTHDAFTITDLAKYDKVSFPSGPTQLNLPGLYVDQIITYYEVWLTDGADAPVSEIKTYRLNYEYQAAPRWFSYLSSFGCYDTIYTIGKGSVEYDLISQKATLTKTNTFQFSSGEVIEFDTQLEHKETVLSGYVSKRELKRYRDFFLSPNKFQVRSSRAYPVMLNSKSIKELRDNDYLFYVEFETGYRFTDELWTEDGEDADSTSVDVSAFWPAVSVPEPTNFDHLYYRKTATYNQAEIDTYLAAITATESTNNAAQASQITALNNSLAGKSNIVHDHDGTYLNVGTFNDWVITVGAALFYRGAWVAGFVMDPDDAEAVPGYAVGDVVDRAGSLWRSLIADNAAVPGADLVSWVKLIYSKTPFTAAAAVTLDWQAGLIPGKDFTWAQKYGNDLPGIAGAWTSSTDSGNWEIFHGFQLIPTYSGDTLTTVDITADLYPIKINFI